MSGWSVIRPYCGADLDGVFRLDEVCFASEFRFGRLSMRRFAEAKDAITLVAEDDALGIAGFVIVHLEAAQGGCRGYVVTLDVAPEFRRLGLAGQLMDEVERQVGLRGADRVELHAFSGNEAGIAFYETRGYTRVETRRGYYGVGIDAYVYRKTLTQ